MRLLNLLLAVCLVGICSADLKAQDIHFSMYDFAPIYLNPALTGAYEGSFRIGGIYRDQWNGLKSNIPLAGGGTRPVTGFKTPDVYLDAPLFRGFGKADWVGLGANFFYDMAGTANLTKMDVKLALAYHLALSKSRRVYLSIAPSVGYVQNRLDASALVMEDGTDAILVNGANTKSNYIDMGAGLLLNAILNSKMNFNLGFSANHILEPTDNFLNETAKVPRRYTAHGTFNIDVAPRITLSPTAMYNLQAKTSELNTQLLAGFHLNQQKDVTLVAGAGYRFGEAGNVIARLGFNYKQFKIGAAYDIVTGGLTGAGGRKDAFELGVMYTAKIYPNKVVPLRILCPRF